MSTNDISIFLLPPINGRTIFAEHHGRFRQAIK